MLIKAESKIQLTKNIAQAIVQRLKTTEDAELAKNDLNRLNRLFLDGQIQKKVMTEALKAMQANSTLWEMHQELIESELKKLELPTQLTGSLEPPATTAVIGKGRDKNTVNYVSSRVIVPATVDVGSLENTEWQKMTGDNLATLLQEIGPVDDKYLVSPQSTMCYWHPIPWYDDVNLIRLTDPTWSDAALAIYYLSRENNLFRLNGTSPPIHEINAKAPIKLTEHNAADYLRFFCFFVRGEEGPFYLTESMEDPMLPETSDSTVKKVLSDFVAPVSYQGLSEQGHFLFDTRVFYSNALFQSNFSVQPTGMIEMLDDEPVAADLPIKVHAPIA